MTAAPRHATTTILAPAPAAGNEAARLRQFTATLSSSWEARRPDHQLHLLLACVGRLTTDDGCSITQQRARPALVWLLHACDRSAHACHARSTDPRYCAGRRCCCRVRASSWRQAMRALKLYRTPLAVHAFARIYSLAAPIFMG